MPCLFRGTPVNNDDQRTWYHNMSSPAANSTRPLTLCRMLVLAPPILHRYPYTTYMYIRCGLNDTYTPVANIINDTVAVRLRLG